MKTDIYTSPLNSPFCPYSPSNHSYNNFNQNNTSSPLNDYRLQLFSKDKTIMNYKRQIDQQNQKFESLAESMEQKDKQISQYENNIKELNLLIDKLKNEDYRNQELINKYKFEIENEIQINEQNKNNYDNNYNIIYNSLEQSKLKIENLEQINNKLKSDVNKLQKEIYSQNEIIENNKLINNKLSNENKNIPLMNKKLIDYESNVKSLKDEIINLKKYNKDLINDNKKINIKLNEILKEKSEKENICNLQVYDLNSKLNEINKEKQNIVDDFRKCKQEKDVIIQEQEKYCNFVNQKMNEINEFLITAFNSNDLMKLSDEINYKNNTHNLENDIKFELVDNCIFEIKKNILKYIINMKEKNSIYINKYNNISRDKDMLESHHNEIIGELNMYKQNQNDIENMNREIALNYEKLKETYTKLYNDYTLFTESNTKYVNDTQNFYLDLITEIKNVLGDKTVDDKEKGLNQILNEYVNILINKFTILSNKINENDKNEKITCKKILELSNLLEESQNLMKKYEAENRKLKDENEKINYRYNLLKASIDVVEYEMKS